MTVHHTLTATDRAFRVEAYEKIDYSLIYVDGVFEPDNTEIAGLYRPHGRCLMVIDETVLGVFGDQIDAYFGHHGIELTTFPVVVKETDKTLQTVERMVDRFGQFGLLRKEPVLVVGGGLTTDVAGFACAAFRRSSKAGS